MIIRRFTQRLLIANLFLFFILISLGGTVAGFLLSAYFRTDFDKQQTYRAEKMRQQLDGALDQLNRLSLSIVASRQIREVFLSIPDTGIPDYFLTHLSIRDDVRDALFSFTAMRALTGRICLVSRNGDLLDLSNQQDTINFSKPELKKMVQSRKILLGGEYKVFLPPHAEAWSIRGEPVISIVRLMQDNDHEYGIMEINQRMENLTWIWETPDGKSTEQLGLYDPEGRQLWASFDKAPKKLSEYPAPSPELIDYRSSLENANWQLVLFANSDSYRKPVLQTITILGGALALVFLISALFSWLSLRSITLPVRQLTMEVRHISDFGTEFRMPSTKAPEEVMILGTAFRDLLVILKREHEALVIAQNQEISARMVALQAQLNPHFIFNTLMCISAYGKKADGETVHQMCNGLSAMLRYTLENPGQSTTLKQEIDQAEYYLNLMAKRFNPYFTFSMDRMREIEGSPVPRLLLQPVLENCFVHGFADRPGPWRIELCSRREQDCWMVEIRDNGQGIASDRIQNLLAELGDSLAEHDEALFNRDFSRGKLGLLGTVARLRLLHGKLALFTLESSESGGCLIRLGGPIDV